MKIFADRLKQLRGCRSQKELASILGITQVTLSRFETSSREPDLELLCRISMELKVSTDYLLGLVDDPHGHFGGSPATRVSCDTRSEIAAKIGYSDHDVMAKDTPEALAERLARVEAEVASLSSAVRKR